MSVEFVKGLPRASRVKRVAFFVALGFVMAAVGKRVVGPAFRTYLSVGDPVEAFRRFQWLMIAIGAGLVPFAAYMAVVAARIIRHCQYPYPGMTVWRDTPIVRGRKALVRGWIIALLAVFLLGIAVYAATIPATVARRSHPAKTAFGDIVRDRHKSLNPCRRGLSPPTLYRFF